MATLTLTPPPSLSGPALERWTAIAPTLRGDVDRELLATYCQVWARWKQAEDSIAKTGQLVRNDKGRPVANPLIAIAKDAGSQVRTLEQKLGIGQESEESEGAPAPGALLTRRDLAAAFGVHMQTVTKWERDGLPIAELGRKGKPSRYLLPACIQWFINRELSAKGVDTAATTPQQERALLDRQRREEIELRLQMRRGALVSAEEAARDLSDCANTVKARMRRIPDAIADRVLSVAEHGPYAVKAILLKEIDEALSELAKRADAAPEAVAS